MKTCSNCQNYKFVSDEDQGCRFLKPIPDRIKENKYGEKVKPKVSGFDAEKCAYYIERKREAVK